MKNFKSGLRWSMGILCSLFLVFVAKHHADLLPENQNAPKKIARKLASTTLVVDGKNDPVVVDPVEFLDDDEVAKEITKAEDDRDNALKRLREKDEETVRLGKEKIDLMNKVSELERNRESEAEKNRVENSKIQKDLAKALADLSDRTAVTETLNKEKMTLEASIEQLKTVLARATAEDDSEKIKEKLGKLETDLKAKEEEVGRVKEMTANLESEIATLKSQRDQELALSVVHEENIKAQLKQAMADLGEKDAAIKKLEDARGDLESQLDAMEKKIASSTEANENKKAEENKAEVVKVEDKKPEDKKPEDKKPEENKPEDKLIVIKTPETKTPDTTKESTKETPKVTKTEEKTAGKKEDEKETGEDCVPKKKPSAVNMDIINAILAPTQQLSMMRDFMNTMQMQQQQQFQQFQQYMQFQQFQQFQEFQQFQKFQEFQGFGQSQHMNPMGRLEQMGQRSSFPSSVMQFDVMDWVGVPVRHENQGLLNAISPFERGGVPQSLFGNNFPNYQQTPYPFHYSVNNYFGPGMVNMGMGEFGRLPSSAQDSFTQMLSPGNPQMSSPMGPSVQPNSMAPMSPGNINLSGRTLQERYSSGGQGNLQSLQGFKF